MSFEKLLEIKNQLPDGENAPDLKKNAIKKVVAVQREEDEIYAAEFREMYSSEHGRKLDVASKKTLAKRMANVVDEPNDFKTDNEALWLQEVVGEYVVDKRGIRKYAAVAPKKARS